MSCLLKRKTTDISYDTCSSEEDEGCKEKVGKKTTKKIKKSRVEQTFRIHYSGFLTSDDRNERRKSSAKLILDINTSEDKIRNSLISELPQLGGKNFSFFTKDNDGRHYSCPCKLKCEGKDHTPAEWNARNISRAARSNRTVYISIETDNMSPSTSGYDEDPINSHLNEQERDSASYLHQSVSCPNLPSTGFTGLENRTMTQFVGQNNSDLRRQQLELTQFPQAFPVESDWPGDRNRGNANVQESSSASSRGCETTLPRQENRKFTSLVNLGQFPQPEQTQIAHLRWAPHGETTDSLSEEYQEGVPKSLNASSSGIGSISGESSPMLSANLQEEQFTFHMDSLLDYLDSDSLLDYNHGFAGQENRKFTSLVYLGQFPQPEQTQIAHLQCVPHGETTDSLSEEYQEGVPKSLNASSSGIGSILGESSPMLSANLQEEQVTFDMDPLLDYLNSEEPPLEIKEIVPNDGDVKGGFTFYLELTTRCIADFEVQFGQNDPISVQRIDETHYKGTVPENASSLVGEVEVRIVKTSRDIENAVTFRYTDESLKERHEVEENIKYEAELRNLLLATAKKFGEMNLKLKEATCRYDEHGGSKTQPLPLLHMVADTAARINSIQFFEILFSTHVGHTAFREYQSTLKEIAKANGHEELASLLEKEHLMFGDDENDLDGNEDYNEITKGIVEDQPIEKWSLQSTDSLKHLHGYLGDGESSTPLSSLPVSVGEIFSEDTFAEQQAYLVFNGRDQSGICQAKGEMSGENREDGESYTSFPPLQVSSGEDWLEEKFEVQKVTLGPQDSNTSDKLPSKGGANAGERSSDVQDYTVKEPQETLESKSTEESDNYHEKGPSYGKIEMREDHELYENKSLVEEMKLVGLPSQDPACSPADYVPRGSYETLSCKEGKSLGKVRGPSHEQVWMHLGNLDIHDASSTIQPSDGFEGCLHTRKLDKKPSKISTKSHYKMNSPLRFQRPQEHLELDCSSPSVHSPMELEESLSCASANEPTTGPDVIDHSNHPNNFEVDGNQNKGESRCSFMRNNRVTIITFVIRVSLIAFVIAIFALGIGKEERASPTPEPTSGPCNLTQHWIEDENGSHLCIDCRTCPPGEGLSKECGDSELLPFNTMVTCVPCIAGVSFSRYEDSSSCTPCSSCSQGQVVNQSCSTKWDVKCSKKCFSKDRYYDEEKGDCLNCSRCCGDDADLVVAECREKLGAGSSMICSFNSSVNRCYKTSQPTHTTVQNRPTLPTSRTIRVSVLPTHTTVQNKPTLPTSRTIRISVLPTHTTIQNRPTLPTSRTIRISVLPTHTTVQSSLTQLTPRAILLAPPRVDNLSPPRVDNLSPPRVDDSSSVWILVGSVISVTICMLILSALLLNFCYRKKRLAKFLKSSNRTPEEEATCGLSLKDLEEENLSLISHERKTLAGYEGIMLKDVSFAVLEDLSRLLAPAQFHDWRSLGYKLGFTCTQMKEFSKLTPVNSTEMLLQHLSQRGDMTVLNFFEVLKAVGSEDAAQVLEEYLFSS